MKLSKIILVLVLAAILVSPVFVSAATNTGVKPGNFWYGFDIAFEKINLFFTFNSESKAIKALKYADERLAEVEAIANENKPEAVATAMVNYQENVSLATAKSKEIKDKEKAQNLLSTIADNTSKHQEVLGEVYNKVPDEAKEAIEKAIEVSIKGHEEALKEIQGLKKTVEELQKDIELLKQQGQSDQSKEIEALRKEIETLKSQRSSQSAKPQVIEKVVEKIVEVPSATHQKSTVKLSNSEIIEKVKPAVVYIQTGEGAGSGMIIEADGLILTNAHVVKGVNSVKVKLSDKRLFVGSIVGRDEFVDLALIKISVSGLVAVEFGNSDASVLRQGDEVFSLGYPFGLEGDVSFKEGTISRRQEFEGITYLETSAETYPGNSGGPLVNRFGQVIGINTLGVGIGAEGILLGESIKLAIPVNTVNSYIPELKVGISDTDDIVKPDIVSSPQSTISLAVDTPAVGTVIKGIKKEDTTFTKINFCASSKNVIISKIVIKRGGVASDDDILAVSLHFDEQNLYTSIDHATHSATFPSLRDWITIPANLCKTLTIKASIDDNATIGNSVNFCIYSASDIVSSLPLKGTFPICGNAMTIVSTAPIPESTISTTPEPQLTYSVETSIVDYKDASAIQATIKGGKKALTAILSGPNRSTVDTEYILENDMLDGAETVWLYLQKYAKSNPIAGNYTLIIKETSSSREIFKKEFNIIGPKLVVTNHALAWKPYFYESYGYQVDTLSFTIKNDGDLTTYLRSAEVLLDGQNLFVVGTSLSKYKILSGETVVLTVGSGSAIDGSAIIDKGIYTMSVGFVGQVDGELTTLVNYVSTVAVPTLEVATAKPKPTLAASSLPSTVLSVGEKTLYRWTITADSKGDIGWKKVIFDVSGSVHIGSTDTFTVGAGDGASIDGIYMGTSTTPGTSFAKQLIAADTLKVYNIATGEEVLSDKSVQNFSSGGARVTFISIEEKIVPAGTTKTYELRGDITYGGLAGDSISTKIDKRSINLVTDTYTNIAGTAATLVWTDRSAANHSESTTDWYNDYSISYIPTPILSLSK